MPIIDGEKFFLRIPKCYLRQSWARGPENSKNNPMVQAHEHQDDREPSLVVDRGVDVGLDSSNKAQAACLVNASSKPTSLAFFVEQPFH
jgi:hypothetical protein